MNTKEKKIVFFLGAGFSYDAGIPLQSTLMEKVFEKQNDPEVESLGNFLEDAFKRPKDVSSTLALEDFYTPIDRCIATGRSFRGYSGEYLTQMRNILSYRLAEAISEPCTTGRDDYVRDFLKKILTKHYSKPTPDYITVITSNWDNVIEKCLIDYTHKVDDTEKSLVFDYGCWAVSFQENSKKQLIPALVAKEQKNKPFKFYKIHGSVNWYNCPICNRVFIDNEFRNKKDIICRFCDPGFKNLTEESKKGITLNKMMIYPTALKDISNIQLQMLWQNMITEFSEASHIVFIGYSLPYSDFELRQMLLRYVPDNTAITVVTINDPNTESLTKSYKGLFGAREIKFYLKGTSDFVNTGLDRLIFESFKRKKTTTYGT